MAVDVSDQSEPEKGDLPEEIEAGEVVEGEVREVEGTALVIPASNRDAAALQPILSVEESLTRWNEMVEFVEGIMTEGLDFGLIPGVKKKTLFKPGAEKLGRFFGISPHYQLENSVERWNDDDPLFFYRYRCVGTREGFFVADAIGSCNSREDKYRWRWVRKDKLPRGVKAESLESRDAKISEFAFAIEKRETTGEWGKPAEYWRQFDDEIASNNARSFLKKTAKGQEYDAWEIGGALYRIPNPDAFSLVNTMDKMAQKRAFVAMIIVATMASEFFTQDVEDMPRAVVSGTDAYEDPQAKMDRLREAAQDGGKAAAAQPEEEETSSTTSQSKPPKTSSPSGGTAEEPQTLPRPASGAAATKPKKPKKRSWDEQYIKELRKSEFFPSNAAGARIVGTLNLSPFNDADDLGMVMEWIELYKVERESLESDEAWITATAKYAKANQNEKEAIGRFGQEWLDEWAERAE